MIAALSRTNPIDREDPPKRFLYLSLVAISPCLALGALWNQGDLNLVSSAMTLSASAVLLLNLERIQNYLRPEWAREYEAKLAPLRARLLEQDLSASERELVLNRIQDLNDRYHLVTSPAVTYRWIKRMGAAMGSIAQFLRSGSH
ncbi:hypothetical protein ACFFQ5_21925 [Pseudomonas brassicacearum]|uniref:hypothetical protein n=1 Tax=Pseudomonas brassicacearum TaxID=930166 RepID=UPI0008799BE0|nr:hypothetical protein [Pseudomonas brassicacearum]KAB0528580.1 hypothetical protein F7R20_03470 [Pseudomonas brassicacearum subsp. brassicacearum]NJP59200.1 hypothetical protein [Pseudomonas brassicacearum]SDP19202.1 hypothetical protein SAMN04490180_0592 [Pseudomonas brassicacearum]